MVEAELPTAQPSLFRYVLGFLAVGIAWGFTTPFMRRATMDYVAPSRPELEDKNASLAKRKILSIWYSIFDLVRRPAYFIPLLMNLSGSVWFFLMVGQAGECLSLSLGQRVQANMREVVLTGVIELSLTVPITNSLAFLFTVLGEWWAEGKVISKGTPSVEPFTILRFV
jgi:hypothetical protein